MSAAWSCCAPTTLAVSLPLPLQQPQHPPPDFPTPPSSLFSSSRPCHWPLHFQRMCLLELTTSFDDFCSQAALVAASLLSGVLFCSDPPESSRRRLCDSREELCELVSRPHVRRASPDAPNPPSLSARAKAKRLIEERMRDVDVVLEVRDSRAPLSCRFAVVFLMSDSRLTLLPSGMRRLWHLWTCIAAST
jgi:hypothetical protein